MKNSLSRQVKTDGEEGDKVFAVFKPWLENPKVKKVLPTPLNPEP